MTLYSLRNFASNCGLSHWNEISNVSWTSFTSGFEDRPKGRLLDLIHDGNEHGALTCEIPASILNAVELWRLILDNNNLYGSIPSGLGSLEQLTTINLRNNNLSGEIPSDICDSGAYIFVRDNQLCPTYPDCVSSYDSVQDTSIATNSKVPGYCYRNHRALRYMKRK